MVVSDLELYEFLIEKFGITQAKAITVYIEVKVDKQVDVKTNVLATKHDMFDLKVVLYFSRDKIVHFENREAVTLL